MLNENIWNETSRLSPKLMRYCAAGYAFKKTPQNLELIEKHEKQQKLDKEMKFVLKSKEESQDRHNARKLERLIL